MDLDVIDLSVPRRAQYLHKSWKRHQDAGCWVDINLVQENRPVPRRSKHVPLMEAQTSTVETKQFMTERRKPVVGRGASHEPGNDQAMLNEVDTDFRIPGLPHSVVKQAQNSRVRELVKKIENHPHRHALQRDIQQKKTYKPFSAVSKQMVQDVGNVELFELFETDPKTQCKECLSYWSEGIVDCTCGHLLNETVANRCFIKKGLS